MSSDGGSAFPQPMAISPADDIYYSAEGGMSLRDYLAAGAMRALMARAPGMHGEDTLLISADAMRDIATSAYRMADIMLEERR